MTTSRKAMLAFTTFLVAWTVFNSWWSLRYGEQQPLPPHVAPRDYTPILPPSRTPTEPAHDLVEPAAPSPSSSSSSAPSAATVPELTSAIEYQQPAYFAVRDHMASLNPEAAYVNGELGPDFITIQGSATDAELLAFVHQTYAACREYQAAAKAFDEHNVSGTAAEHDRAECCDRQQRRVNEIARQRADLAWNAADSIWGRNREETNQRPFSPDKE